MSGETAEKEKLVAEEQVDPGYKFHVSTLNIFKNNKGASVYGYVIAWNNNEIQNIELSWKEYVLLNRSTSQVTDNLWTGKKTKKRGLNMSPAILKIIGVIVIIIGFWGILSGRVMAGSRGLQPNYYDRNENPVLFYFFICIYIGIGLLVLLKA